MTGVILAILLGALSAADSRNYGLWLEEEVTYIISSTERSEFEALATDDEKKRFIETFWKRRDNDPSTERNEFREEHSRRFTFANKHFANARPGWRSDRGRVYILHGEPDQRIQFASTRTALDGNILSEAAGNSPVPETFLLPDAEMWTYQYLPGLETVRGTVDILFLKASPADISQLQLSRQNRLASPNGGPTRLDVAQYFNNGIFNGVGSLGQDFRIAYVGRPRFISPGGYISFLQRNPDQLDFFEINKSVNETLRSPVDLLEKRERRWRQLRQDVASEVYFKQIPVVLDYFFLRSDTEYTYIPISVSIDGRQLEEVDELILGAEMRRDGRTVANFLDKVSFAATDREVLRRKGYTYQTRLAVLPGEYEIHLSVIDRTGGRLESVQETLTVPDLSERPFNLSSLVLCRSVEKVKDLESSGIEQDRAWVNLTDLNPLKVDDYLMVPAAGSVFRRKDRMTVFFEIYGPRLKSRNPDVSVEMTMIQGGKPVAASVPTTLEHLTAGSPTKITYAQGLSLSSLRPGRYLLQVEVHDRISDQRIVQIGHFRVL